jgi:DNA-binding NarL/FixJ family response regulator
VTSPLSVLVVDDHPVVREGLRSMLTCDGVTVVGDVGTCAEALRAIASLTPDVVLLDMQLADGDGLSVLRGLSQLARRPAVLVLSMHDDPALVRRAMQAGAAGYVLKGITRADLLTAMRAAHEGRATLDPKLRPANPSAPEPFTAVELRVLRLMAEGRTNREIAETLRWSVANAKKYAQRIFEKLDATDRTQAVATALRLRLLT